LPVPYGLEAGRSAAALYPVKALDRCSMLNFGIMEVR